jgi:hypothetical protein
MNEMDKKKSNVKKTETKPFNFHDPKVNLLLIRIKYLNFNFLSKYRKKHIYEII